MSKGHAHNLQMNYPRKVKRRHLFTLIGRAGRNRNKSDGGFGLLGSIEINGGDSQVFKKWQAVLPECDRQLMLLQRNMTQVGQATGAMNYWLRIVRGVGRTQSVHQLSLLNSYINESAGYDPQAANAGVRDVWRSPLNLIGFRGDCEDFAITKYFSLLALGYPEEAIRFIVVKDSRRRVIHAVTSVDFEHECYLLDSLRPVATKEVNMLHYQPLVSMRRNMHFTHFRTAEMCRQFFAQRSNVHVR